MDDPVATVLAECAELPLDATHALFARYGRPLELATPTLDPMVPLADGASILGRLSYRAPVDVIANDHFVLVRPGEPALAMPAPLFAAAVAALRRRAGLDAQD